MSTCRIARANLLWLGNGARPGPAMLATPYARSPSAGDAGLASDTLAIAEDVTATSGFATRRGRHRALGSCTARFQRFKQTIPACPSLASDGRTPLLIDAQRAASGPVTLYQGLDILYSRTVKVRNFRHNHREAIPPRFPLLPLCVSYYTDTHSRIWVGNRWRTERVPSLRRILRELRRPGDWHCVHHRCAVLWPIAKTQRVPSLGRHARGGVNLLDLHTKAM